MNGTPRLRSAFSPPPGSGQKPKNDNATASGSWSPRAPLPNPAISISNGSEPAIPISVIDAPTQRLYVTFFYLGLTVWRLADYFSLVTDETDSLWLFMKWVAIDSVFLYGLPALKIPWLKWSSSTITTIFVAHAMLNAVLMFRIPIPIGSWLLAVVKLVYDRELAISEIHVKPGSILHNSSLILGKQIIHILPEGSAMLNPDQRPFCLSPARNSVILPLRVNQTSPILLELLRIDLDTNLNETISIKGKELRKLVRQAKKALPANSNSSPWLLELPVKDQGLYRLQKVVDESKLEVRRRPSHALVVQCPSALVKAAPRHKCKGDLSDFHLEVKGTPPFKVKYRKTVNTEENHVVLSIHPDNKVSTHEPADTIASLNLNDQVNPDFSRARTHTSNIPLNESMGIAGSWQYLVDEVHDSFGNFVNYSSRTTETSPFKLKGESRPEQMFDVHERPKAGLDGYSSQRPLKLPLGKTGVLPVWLISTDADEPESLGHELTYSFAPQEQMEDAVQRQVGIHGKKTGFQVSEPGLYTLKAVSSEYCTGEILEPSSCLLQNPQHPDMTFTAENIPDTCAGNSIGLLVDLHLIGTPPFRISYFSHREGSESIQNIIDTNSLQKRLELRPTQAGHYTYEFLQISDAIYKDPRSLANKQLILEQDVKPPASAWFRYGRPKKSCIDDPVSFDVEFSGEGPWDLEYEIAHNGQRKKIEVKDIVESTCEITTDALRSGGDYSLILTSVTDRSGCKALLEHERKIEVSFQKPKVSFGHLDDKRSILALEGKDISLPLRLQGKPPWTVSYRNLALPEAQEMDVVIHQNNDQLIVNKEGTYEIVSLRDASCPGLVDASQGKFQVQWIPRPGLSAVQSSLVENVAGKFIKKGVCEGDEDSTDIVFTGTAPYTVEYNLKKSKPHRGLHSLRSQKLTAGFSRSAFKMETSEPGLYEYEFSKLGDGSYSHSASTYSALTVQQEVYSRPSARFSDVGKTYKYCKEEEMGDEVIPITFTGLPPFHLEIEIRHHANTKPETIEIPHINERQYDLRIPHRKLAIGTHAVTLRKVSDAHNCQKKMDFDAPYVHVSVADTPTINTLEEQTDFCVGDRISYTLSGTPPFKVFYTFQNIERKASLATTTFKRIAEKPGEFRITGISDQRSTEDCKVKTDITKIIHEMPSVRISKGKTSIVDIHEGGEAEIFFEFGGTPPFQFTYKRSTNPKGKGKTPEILETKSDISYEYTKTVRASDEGIYEVISIKDKYCAFSTHKSQGKSGQKLLTY